MNPGASRDGAQREIFTIYKRRNTAQAGRSTSHDPSANAPAGLECAPFFLVAAIAQLVEQRIRNAWVRGSNPLCGTKKYQYN